MAERRERPFAEQAYHLCVRSGLHNADAWFCENCSMIERRLTPIFDLPAHREILQDMNLSMTINIGELLDRLAESFEKAAAPPAKP